MGCDIHLFVEVFDGDVWKLAPGQLENCERCNGSGLDPVDFICGNCGGKREEHAGRSKKCLFDSTHFVKKPVPCGYYCQQGKSFTREYYSDRNYDLFGVLSGVRGNSVRKFTIENRGVPFDCDPFVRKYLESVDIHSRGYYSLEELERYDWEPDEFEGFRETIRRMRSLLKDEIEDVRIVFGYDN